jgi:serine/threonine-protein kinase HipA
MTMTTMPSVTVLDVLLQGGRVGTLTLLPGDRILFTFSDDYIARESRPTLSLSFKGDLGALVTDVPITQTRLPPFFSNLLPEGPLRTYLAGRARVKEQREFFLLWALGRDLPGAVTVGPAEGQDWPPDAQTGEGQDGKPEAALRFSLAGVQLKFSAVMERTGGLTIPAEGVGGAWILKLPSAIYEAVPENEFAMMSLARAVGITVPGLKLINLEDVSGLPEGIGRLSGRALAVQRFDRTPDGKAVHIEDFAQVFGVYPEGKYKRATYRNIAEVIWAETGEDGIGEFIRRLVFNALIGNADMHLKNWSLIYPDGRQPALAPGYDFVSTIAYIEDDAMALKLVRSRKMADLSLDALAHLAAKARLPETLVLNIARETVARFKDAWTGNAHDLPLSRETRRLIDAHVRSLPLSEV